MFVNLHDLLKETAMTQPTVSPEFTLLAVAHDHCGLKLDLYGEQDEDGYMVCDVTLTGSKVSLFEIINTGLLESLSNFCDDYMPSWKEQRSDAKQGAAAARAELRAEVIAAMHRQS